MRFATWTWILFVVLVVLPGLGALTRFSQAGFDGGALLPEPAYRVHVRTQVLAEKAGARIGMYLPQNETHLALGSRWLNSDLPAYSESYFGGNRLGEWSATEPGTYSIENAFTAVLLPARYEIDPALQLPGAPLPEDTRYLEATDDIQVHDERIAAAAAELTDDGGSLVETLRGIHRTCRDLAADAHSDQDAVSALTTGSASSAGRSRLFVALARHLGLPARTVTGLFLEPGSSWSELTWVEVHVGPSWIPFCPTQDEFARAPCRHLPIRRSATELFVASAGAQVHRFIEVERTLDVNGRFADSAAPPTSRWLSLWSSFEDAGVPIDVLRIVLMIPLGALVLVVLRNVVGIQTFGFFLPLLVAVAALRTGLAWGLAGFCGLVAFVFLVRIPLERQRLLHYPQMAILLTAAVAAMLAMAALGLQSGNWSLSYVTFFPFAILTITTERFAVMVEEEGVLRTAQVVLMTAIAIAICYGALSIMPLQSLFMGFPELLLPIVFMNYAIGRWVGVRLLEYWRFRRLVAPTARVRHA